METDITRFKGRIENFQHVRSNEVVVVSTNNHYPLTLHPPIVVRELRLAPKMWIMVLFLLLYFISFLIIVIILT